MNARWAKVTAVLAAVNIIALVLIWMLRSPEPVYHGKRLTFWVEQIRSSGADQEEAQAAIREIGPAAVPFLLQQVRRDVPIHRRLYQKVWLMLPGVAQRRLPYPNPRDHTPRGADLVYRTAVELSALGPAVVPRLCKALGDSDEGVRVTAVTALGKLGTGAKLAVPTLIRMLRTRNRWFRENVTWAYAGGQEIQQAVFVQGPTKSVAAWALANIGPEARPALPQLTSLLRDRDFCTQQHAAMALWRVGRDITGLPILTGALPNRTDPITCCRILTVLGEMGPRAKAAAPAITKLLNQTNGPPSLPDLSQGARDALRKINPDSAPKLDSPSK